MKEQLNLMKAEVAALIPQITSMAQLEDIRVKYLGKKGELTLVLRSMKDVSPEERPIVGQMVNEVRDIIEAQLAEAKESITQLEINRQLVEETIDITLPGKKQVIGHSHPLSIAYEDLKKIFIGMGYSIAEGPEVETDYYIFDALNTPENHPAKDVQDTFYINPHLLLRTQTSSVQVRVMEQQQPPIRIIAPGKVYRADEVDATHSPVFHQMEGLVIDKDIKMSDLKGALAEFAKQLYGDKVKVKFRPHHFPFTEPSAEMDVTCVMCGGEGCRVCKGTGWIEILGCGMVHPNVLRMSGIDPEIYSGFAFGMGIDRIAMLRYGIDDIRLMFENDVRFLKQF